MSSTNRALRSVSRSLCFHHEIQGMEHVGESVSAPNLRVRLQRTERPHATQEIVHYTFFSLRQARHDLRSMEAKVWFSCHLRRIDR